MYDRAPRMLPHAYEPTKVDVAVEHTPEKVGPVPQLGREPWLGVHVQAGEAGLASLAGVHAGM